MNAAIAERLRDALQRRMGALRRALDETPHLPWRGGRGADELIAYCVLLHDEPALWAICRRADERERLLREEWARRVERWRTALGSCAPPEQGVPNLLATTWGPYLEEWGRAVRAADPAVRRQLEPEFDATERWVWVRIEVGPEDGWTIVRGILRGIDDPEDPLAVLPWNGLRDDGTDVPGWRPSLERFHDWVLDQLAVGVATSTILERYARGVERFSADILRKELEGARRGRRGNPDELLASRKMAEWLHAQGLDPFNEVQLGNGRADLGVLSGPDQVVVEAKVVRSGDSDRTIRERLRDGLNQARRYADQLNHVAGYLLVFWLDDATRLDGPREVSLGGGAVRVVVVDLRKAPSSLGSARSVRLQRGRS